MQLKLTSVAKILSLLDSTLGTYSFIHVPMARLIINFLALDYARDVECVLCTAVIRTVVAETRDNPTEENILSALNDVCSTTGDPACMSFVEQHSGELSKILAEETDPSLACTQLGVC